jgi:hypothetical protein
VIYSYIHYKQNVINKVVVKREVYKSNYVGFMSIVKPGNSNLSLVKREYVHLAFHHTDAGIVP